MKVAEADFGGKLPDMNRNDIHLGEIAPLLPIQFAGGPIRDGQGSLHLAKHQYMSTDNARAQEVQKLSIVGHNPTPSTRFLARKTASPCLPLLSGG